jgi:hypothetical protein
MVRVCNDIEGGDLVKTQNESKRESTSYIKLQTKQLRKRIEIINGNEIIIKMALMIITYDQFN